MPVCLAWAVSEELIDPGKYGMRIAREHGVDAFATTVLAEAREMARHPGTRGT